VELVVLGTSDLGGRGSVATRRPPTPARAPRPAAIAPVPLLTTTDELDAPDSLSAALPTSTSFAPVLAATAAPTPPANRAAALVPPIAQDEFTFNEVESRGHFDKTERNLFEGQDLDVPTYLRKGIKLAL
jgi:cell division protein FtsZ